MLNNSHKLVARFFLLCFQALISKASKCKAVFDPYCYSWYWSTFFLISPSICSPSTIPYEDVYKSKAYTAVFDESIPCKSNAKEVPIHKVLLTELKCHIQGCHILQAQMYFQSSLLSSQEKRQPDVHLCLQARVATLTFHWPCISQFSSVFWQVIDILYFFPQHMVMVNRISLFLLEIPNLQTQTYFWSSLFSTRKVEKRGWREATSGNQSMFTGSEITTRYR